MKKTTLPSSTTEQSEPSVINFKNIADRSPGLIDVYCYKTSRYIYVSEAVKYILGYTPEDMLDEGLEFIISRVHPDDIEGSAVKNRLASKSVETLRADID